MKKITFLALHLGYGGIEKCISDVANLLCDKYKIEILSIYKMYDKEVFQLNDKVKVTYLTNLKPNREEFKTALKHLNIFKVIKEGIKAINILLTKKKVMINAIKQCDSDIIISSRIYLNNLLGKYGKGYKIGWEYNHHHENIKYKKIFMKSCEKLDKVVLVSESLKNDYSKLFNENNITCECVCIPNFIYTNHNNKSKSDTNNLISVGRLSKEKGMLDLIDVFKIINEKNKETHLNIIGDGPESKKIKDKIDKLGLKNYITLHGFQNQDYINNIYSLSSIYLMTSYTESFGLVLVEAMNKGVVPIAFNSAEGAKDIINNENGYLIDRNNEEMANLVLELLDNKSKLKKISKEAITSSDNFNDVNIKDKWLNLLKEKK